MDPNECLRKIREAIADGRDTAAAAYMQDLDEWLSKGGFLPSEWFSRRSEVPPSGKGSNTGHGHVWARPDGVKSRCGGPITCQSCARDLASISV